MVDEIALRRVAGEGVEMGFRTRPWTWSELNDAWKTPLPEVDGPRRGFCSWNSTGPKPRRLVRIPEPAAERIAPDNETEARRKT